MQKIADIIIPHHNRHDHLFNLLNGITNDIFNIIIVSGGSFAKNCNKGARIAETSNLVFLNDDVDTNNNNILDLLSFLDRFDLIGTTEMVGIDKYWGIGFQENKDGKITGYLSKEEKPNLLPCGFFFVIKKENWNFLGGFNEDFINGNEDTDLGLRVVEAGLKTKIIDLKINHKKSQSAGRMENNEYNKKLFFSLWDQDRLRKFL